MKIILIFCFLWQSLPAFSQQNATSAVVTNPKTFAFVDGQRLDSLDAEYATFEWGAERLFFNYGQSATRKKTTVTNEKGEPFMFARQTIPFTLNFLYFNGWEPSRIYFDKQTFILKKRHDN